jgi:hypothetical protein
MRYNRRKGRQITNAKKHTFDGIQFDSGLELFCYRVLKKEKIPFTYEGKTYLLHDKFTYSGNLYDRGKKDGKKVFKLKSSNVRKREYTPDFINEDPNWNFVIETKGLRTPEFNMRFKLFLQHLTDTGQSPDIYVPSNQKEVLETIRIIKERHDEKKKKL